MALHLYSDLFDGTINRLGSMGDPVPFTPPPTPPNPDQPIFFTPLPAGAQPPGTPVIRTAGAQSFAPTAGGVQSIPGFNFSAAEIAQFMAQAQAAQAMAAQLAPTPAPSPVSISVPLSPPPAPTPLNPTQPPSTLPAPPPMPRVVLPSLPGSAGPAVYASAVTPAALAPIVAASKPASSSTVLIAGGLAIAAIVGGFFFVLRRPK